MSAGVLGRDAVSLKEMGRRRRRDDLVRADHSQQPRGELDGHAAYVVCSHLDPLPRAARLRPRRFARPVKSR